MVEGCYLSIPPWPPVMLLCLAAFFWGRNGINTIDHIQAGWICGHLGDFDRRERRLLMLASFAPDVDGLFMLFYWAAAFVQKVVHGDADGILAEIVASKSRIYGLHHTFGHNFLYAIFIGVLCALFARRKRFRMLTVGILMVLLHFVVDMLTAADWTLPLFWPISNGQYNLPLLVVGPGYNMASWDFALKVVVQWTLKAALLASTVVIYIRHRRTFLELISSNLDRFMTNFAILPFQKRCDEENCDNRAHYRCENCRSDRCILHCSINRDLTITCSNCADSGT